LSELKITVTYPKIIPLERSEKGCMLPKRKSGSANQEAQIEWRKSGAQFGITKLINDCACTSLN
jgi:hypothetical protein